MRRPWPTRGCCDMGGKTWYIIIRNKLVHLYQRIYTVLRKTVRCDRYTPHKQQVIHVTSYYVLVAIQYTVRVSLYFANAASSNRETYIWHMRQFTVAGSTIWYLSCLTCIALQSAKQMTSSEHSTLFLACTKGLRPVCLLHWQQTTLLSTKRQMYRLKQSITNIYLDWASEIFSPSRCRRWILTFTADRIHLIFKICFQSRIINH
jgi:hypothetical protein